MYSNVIQIPIFDWTVNVLYGIGEQSDLDECKTYLEKQSAPYQLIDKLISNLSNGGSSTVQGPNHVIYIAFPRFYGISILFKSLSHEINHVVDDICSDQEINDTETRSYLNGYISQSIYDIGIFSNMLIDNDNIKEEALMLVPMKKEDVKND